jgi:hypothetical protein
MQPQNWGCSLYSKRIYVRNRAILEACREFSCQYCGADDGTVVAAHSNQSRHGKGRGIKASDIYVAALCHSCHAQVDQGKMSRAAKLEMWEEAHRRTARLLKLCELWPDDEPLP